MGWSKDSRTGHLAAFSSLSLAAFRECASAVPGLYLTISARCHSVTHTNIHHYATPSAEELAGQRHSRLIPVRRLGPGYGC